MSPELPAARRAHTFRLRRPASSEIDALVAAEVDAPFSYPDVGATRTGVPAGYFSADRERVLGRGAETWDRAVAALRAWRQFDLPWVHPHRDDVPIEPGELFAFSTQQLGVWTINACRIVYVVDEETADGRRFGFAYGTLDGHMVRGEEAFLLSWDAATDEVRFRVHQFSQLAHPVVRAVGPLARRIQSRFNRQAVDRMVQEISS
jgi:uncharacterized protein (UPF0548 family)